MDEIPVASVAGIDGETLDKALVGLDEELHADPAARERQAAVALARRRRLGLFRLSADRQDHRVRDLAAFALADPYVTRELTSARRSTSRICYCGRSADIGGRYSPSRSRVHQMPRRCWSGGA